jgi:dipeptidase E
MKLVFYSGGDLKQNTQLDEELVKMLHAAAGKGRSPRMTFIPSSSWRLDYYFREFVEYYEEYGIDNLECLPIDRPFDREQLQRCLEGEAIYLSGGNTYYFLKSLKECDMLPKLRKYVEKGGILVGLSAGSIIMTPNIRMAGIPSFDSDLNEVGLKQLGSLGLVKFEFHPHYNGRKRVDEELKKYSKTLNYPLYASFDGAGVVVDGDKISFVGGVTAFMNGDKKRLS